MVVPTMDPRAPDGVPKRSWFDGDLVLHEQWLIALRAQDRNCSGATARLASSRCAFGAKTRGSKAEEQLKFEVNKISWNKDNNVFFLTNGNGCTNILSYPELKPVKSINAHPSTCIDIKLDWPVRTLSFSHDGKLLASASEDLFNDIAEVETGEKLWEMQCESPTFTVVWHPKIPMLEFAFDVKDGNYESS
ncbi:THO complex subunit 3 [Microtus ochrogaster]|uniref:THO complex subunit 3 n=1 Tax=Microtus ochrogaster TaxID=79684 RepID=A0A8J6GA80_MICOH|nr:THO complex subunit 3 [Microtus ochrogaster]